MHHRWTVWEDDRRAVHRIELLLLDEVWEPLASWCVDVGPFDDVEAARSELEAQGAAWLVAVGYQAPLFT